MSIQPYQLGRTTAAETYKHSGRVPIGGLVLAMAILIPAALLLGAIYSALVVYVPFVKLRGCITLFYGGALGGLVGIVCRLAKFRSGLAVMGTMLFTTAISYYTSWAVHPAIFAIREGAPMGDVVAISLAGFSPMMVYDWAVYIHDNGLWAMGKNGGPMKGISVCILWLVEALVIFGASFLSQVVYGNTPFCEDCNQWTEETKELAQLPVSPSDPAWKQFAEGDLDAVKKLQVIQNVPQYVELQLAACETCENSDYVSAVGVTLTASKDGEITKTEADIVRHLRISRAQRNEIQQFAVAMAEAVEAMSEDDPDDISPAVESTPEDPV